MLEIIAYVFKKKKNCDEENNATNCIDTKCQLSLRFLQIVNNPNLQNQSLFQQQHCKKCSRQVLLKKSIRLLLATCKSFRLMENAP